MVVIYNIICFHNPDEENGYLSNWHLSDFFIDGIKFSSLEQYMMYQKAMLFKDISTAGKILLTKNPAEIKSLGREVKNYNDTMWNGMRQLLVTKGIFEKFCQRKELLKKLMDTGDAIFAECAVNDSIWGIGLSMKDENRYDVSKWK